MIENLPRAPGLQRVTMRFELLFYHIYISISTVRDLKSAISCHAYTKGKIYSVLQQGGDPNIQAIRSSSSKQIINWTERCVANKRRWKHLKNGIVGFASYRKTARTCQNLDVLWISFVRKRRRIGRDDDDISCEGSGRWSCLIRTLIGQSTVYWLYSIIFYFCEWLNE